MSTDKPNTPIPEDAICHEHMIMGCTLEHQPVYVTSQDTRSTPMSPNTANELDEVLTQLWNNAVRAESTGDLSTLDWSTTKINAAKAAIQQWASQQTREALEKLLEQKKTFKEYLPGAKGDYITAVPVSAIQQAIEEAGIG